MITKEKLEKRVPVSYEDAMNNIELGHYIMIMAIYCRLIERGLFTDFEDIQEYQKELWENALREKLINECLKGMENNESN